MFNEKENKNMNSGNHSDLISAMISWEAGNPRRIHHFLKVYAFAKTIGEKEHLDENTQLILDTASIVHDIGIKLSEEKYGDCAGPHQEKEGIPAAREMLNSLGYPADVVDRVCYLVGHHHTYNMVDGIDYQILLEADFLVNSYEGGMTQEAIDSFLEKVFQTETGKEFLRNSRTTGHSEN